MKRILIPFFWLVLIAPVFAHASPRGIDSPMRQTTVAADTSRSAAPTAITARSATTVPGRTAARGGMGIEARAAQNIAARSATPTRNVIPARAAQTPTVARGAIPQQRTPSSQPSVANHQSSVARSAALPRNVGTEAISSDYNSCRNAYFTCMDQFCAQADEQFRRCACSPRLEALRARERTISQTTGQLADFVDINIQAIEMTTGEVRAMATATAGELEAMRRDDQSQSATALQNITDVLTGARQHAALSTAGRLDIAGDISQIFSGNHDFIGVADISQLTGTRLFEQVHAQCIEIARPFCPNQNTLNMVVAAYGMAIEQDCNTVSVAIDTRQLDTMAAVRAVEREMQLARLDTFDAQNATDINECIAQVRRDITQTNVCGPGFVRCLDVTGQFLSASTGNPILSPNFYQLENLINLSHDTDDNHNAQFIIMLERHRAHADRGLSTCRLVADHVWEEFVRQALIEIRQAQIARVRNVRNECLDTLNTCFDENLQNLRDFSGMEEQVLLGSRVELSEALCRRHLDMCVNLYGQPNNLIAHMRSVGTTRIAEGCRGSLQGFVETICMPIGADAQVNGFPWGCRVHPAGLASIAIGDTMVGERTTLFTLLIEHARDHCMRPTYRDEDIPAQVFADVTQVWSDTVSRIRTQLRDTCTGAPHNGTWMPDAHQQSDPAQIPLGQDPPWGWCRRP